MSQLSISQLLKAAIVGLLYLSMSVMFVFVVPHRIPTDDKFKTVRVGFSALELMVTDSNQSYFVGKYNGIEMKSIKLTKKRGLGIIGANEFFLQINPKPKYYELKIVKSEQSIIRDIYHIYEISTDTGVVITFDESAIYHQAELDRLFYFGIGFLLLMLFIIVKNILAVIKKKNS